MKKFLLIAFTLCITAAGAQDILLLDSLGNPLNGDTIEYKTHMSSSEAANNNFIMKFQQADVKNNSNQVLDIFVTRYVGSQQPGINDQMCWGGICEPEQTPFSRSRTSLYSEVMQPQQVITGGATGFAGYYMPMGNYGITYFTYEFFDANNTVAPASFTVKFNAEQSVGIKEHDQLNAFSISPNPAGNYFELTNLPIKTTTELNVEVLNIIGKVVVQKGINSNSEMKRMDVSGLNPGIYFVRINSDNYYSDTQKLIIK